MKRALAAILLIYSVGPLVAHAATSKDAISYQYESIAARYDVLSDSSIRVEENIDITYEGTYHSMWRSIATGRAVVTNVEVIDADTGKSLERLDEFADNSNDTKYAGTYAWANKQGVLDIAWYYIAADTTKHWVVRYTLRGIIEFGPAQDGFEWSLFSRYLVPVTKSSVEVVLPAAAAMQGELTQATGTITQTNERTLVYTVGPIAADGGGVKFVARWQKGVVHPPLRSFVITQFLITYGVWVAAVSALLLILCAGSVGYWYYHKRKGTYI